MRPSDAEPFVSATAVLPRHQTAQQASRTRVRNQCRTTAPVSWGCETVSKGLWQQIRHLLPQRSSCSQPMATRCHPRRPDQGRGCGPPSTAARSASVRLSRSLASDACARAAWATWRATTSIRMDRRSLMLWPIGQTVAITDENWPPEMRTYRLEAAGGHGGETRVLALEGDGH